MSIVSMNDKIYVGGGFEVSHSGSTYHNLVSYTYAGTPSFVPWASEVSANYASGHLVLRLAAGNNQLFVGGLFSFVDSGTSYANLVGYNTVPTTPALLHFTPSPRAPSYAIHPYIHNNKLYLTNVDTSPCPAGAFACGMFAQYKLDNPADPPVLLRAMSAGGTEMSLTFGVGDAMPTSLIGVSFYEDKLFLYGAFYTSFFSHPEVSILSYRVESDGSLVRLGGDGVRFIGMPKEELGFLGLSPFVAFQNKIFFGSTPLIQASLIDASPDLIAINSSNQLIPWRLAWSGSSEVKSLKISGNKLYVGGDFDYDAGPSLTYHDLVSFQISPTAAPTLQAWDAELAEVRSGESFYVNRLAVSNNKLYVGGKFLSGRDRYVTSFDLTGPSPIHENVDAGISNGRSEYEVKALHVEGSHLYVGGIFQWEALEGALFSNILSLDINPSSATANYLWTPNLSTGGSVNAIEDCGDVLCLGINSSTTDSSLKTVLKSNDATVSDVAALMNNGNIQALKRVEDTLYAAGHATLDSHEICALDYRITTSGLVRGDWEVFSQNSSQNCYFVDRIDNALSLGGDFIETIEGVPSLAQYNFPTPPPPPGSGGASGSGASSGTGGSGESSGGTPGSGGSSESSGGLSGGGSGSGGDTGNPAGGPTTQSSGGCQLMFLP